ncbi:DUF7507 domain-containing protein [Sinanaerobacter chloroacetimidivorans]|uniref:DUF11 domain-containing protein n=1 Tax=Sinanaerobacter chloroacetimidivorans TaxID=2818044 RepID=A0A8J7W1V9_9FIRM|nr:LPXTG cell wall anchor domain-containing protein [Sinanaerobacter chloroacetimidivorans]MBR0598866.1 DUF11 domain-containing protein [Sinanaerobacter chloroacetimidivorans]
MMAFFNGRKKSKIALAVILIFTLIAVYTAPVSVFAEDLDGTGEQQVVEQTQSDLLDDPSGDGGDGEEVVLEDSDDAIIEDGSDDGEEGTTPEAILDDETSGPAITDEDKELDDEEENSLIPGEMMLTMAAPMLIESAKVTPSGLGISPKGYEQDKLKDLSLDDYLEYKIGPKNDGVYEDNAKNSEFKVRLTFNADKTMVNWSLVDSPSKAYQVKYVIVKGQGTEHNNVYSYLDVNASGDRKLMAALDNQDRVSLINHITFYFEEVEAYNISLEKSVKETASPGETVEYTFVITNTGAKELKNIKLKDPLLGSSGSDIIKTYDKLGAGKSKTFTKNYRIPKSYSETTLNNTAEVAGQYGEDGVVSATDSAVITIMPEYAISLEKTASVTEASPGDEVTYTLTVTNTGQKNLGYIILSDPKLGKEWKKVIITDLGKGETASFSAITHKIPDNAVFPYVNTAKLIGFAEKPSDNVLGSILTLIDNNVFELPPWLLNLLKLIGIDLNEIVKATATVTITQSNGNEEPPQPTVKNYTVNYMVTGSSITVAAIQSGSTTGSSFVVSPPAIQPEYVTYVPVGKTGPGVLNDDGSVTFNFDAGETNYNTTVWYEEESNVEYPTFHYSVYYMARNEQYVADPIPNTTTTGSSVILTPTLYGAYSNYEPKEIEGAEGTIATNGSITVSFSVEDDMEGYIITVWYEKKTVTSETNPPLRGSVTLRDEEIPAAPIPTEELALDDQLILDDAIPAGALPKTGGIPGLLLYGIGALLAGSGFAIKRKSQK